jgi:tRNA A-37 threonylcarbamoyl transferase component Bud32
MSKHVFTPNGNTPMFVNAGNGSIRFVFPTPEVFTIPNSDILRIDDFFDPHIKPDSVPGFWSGLRPETGDMPPLYLKKRVYPTGLGLRNVFSRTNPFRRAEWAAQVADAGISTPAVMAVGMKKKGLLIKTAYLVLEAVSDAEEVSDIFCRPNARARIGLFIEDSSRLIASLHAAKVFHGDFRLSHFYYRGAVLSLWNPGWLRSWSGHLSERSILRDLGSLGAAICSESAKHRPALDDFISCDATAELLLSAYAEVAPGWIPPLGHLVRAVEKNCIQQRR